MDLCQEIHALLEQTGPGHMTGVAYDAAWIARLVEVDEPMGEQAFHWLRQHQLPDGSWGAEKPCYHHDRLICTLAAMIALARRRDSRDRARLRRALLGFDTALRGLKADPVGETIGFEMIAPTLLDEARELGIIRRQENGILDHATSHYQASLRTLAKQAETYRRRGDDYLHQLVYRRLSKLKGLPEGKVNRFVTVAFSSEMAGRDGVGLFDVANLQEPNGSVGHSPSATAYFALYVRRCDPAAIEYLRQVCILNGTGAPFAAPFDIFERTWVLWNLLLAGPLDEKTEALCQPHLDFLQSAWLPGRGVGFSIGYTPKDGDDTSVAYSVLRRCGRQVDIEGLLHYELDNRFRCYELEADASVSVNVHVLEALRQAGYGASSHLVQKVVRFLQGTQLLGLFWLDKWHASPYYPTSHAIIAAAGYVNNLAPAAIEWILETQNADGSWGYYMPTAEETAYCLQALIVWKRHGGQAPQDVIRRGVDWLGEHSEPPYEPLWIGKALYSPLLVVRSAILSALTLAAQE